MRILHLITWLKPGGIERWLLSLLETVEREECAMDVCCKGKVAGELAPLAEKLGATVFHCPLQFDHIRFGRRLTQILREGQYDLVHNHLGTYSGYPTFIAQKLGIPAIASFRSTHFAPDSRTLGLPGIKQLRSLYSHQSVLYALKHAEMITPISQGVLDHLAQMEPNIADRARIIYHGVDVLDLPSDAQKEAFRTELGWPPDAPVIAHAGSFRPPKNHFGLLEAFQLVHQALPEAKLLLIGDGDLRPAIEDKIRNAGLAEHIKLLGKRDDVPAILGHCDVFLMPSRSEGFGRVAIEAAAAHLPVVASRIPGLSEAVADGQTGLLCPVDDTQGMAEAVLSIVKDAPYKAALGEAGRKRVEAEFSTTAAARRLLEVYHECVGVK